LSKELIGIGDSVVEVVDLVVRQSVQVLLEQVVADVWDRFRDQIEA